VSDEHLAGDRDRGVVGAMGVIVRIPHITRVMVQEDRRTLFVFGDNMEGRGLGGQAREMRGEPNTIGVPTKWRPGREERDYFTDADIRDREVWHAIYSAFEKIRAALEAGQNIIIPADGLGTGLAELPTRAPKLHAAIEKAILELGNPDA
jgi:hypothetical protein